MRISFRPLDLFFRALKNSLLLTAGVPLASLIVCFVYSWVVLRSKTKVRYFLDALAFLPHAVPSIVFAVSGLLLSLFVLRNVVPLYGTLTLLVIVHIIQRLSFGTRVTNSAIIAVSEELEEAAEVCGSKATRRRFSNIAAAYLTDTDQCVFLDRSC